MLSLETTCQEIFLIEGFNLLSADLTQVIFSHVIMFHVDTQFTGAGDSMAGVDYLTC